MSPRHPIGPTEPVCLGHHVEHVRSEGELLLRGPDCDLLMEGSESTLNALSSAELPTEATTLAQRHSVPVDLLLQCFADIEEAGMLLRVAAELGASDEAIYLDLFHANCEIRAAEAVHGRFWADVMKGRAPGAVVRGWGIEFFHFINRSNEYMPLAVAQTALPTRLRLIMAQHCVEESDHGGIFLDGLRRSGLPEAAVLDSIPLPTTAALVNFLAELACQDSLAYLATFGVMQQHRRRPDAPEYARFKEHLCATYPDLAPLFEALYHHSMIDEELEHDELVFEAVVKATGLPGANQRALIATATRRFSWAFSEFFNGILHWYGHGGVVAPRRALSVAQFR